MSICHPELSGLPEWKDHGSAYSLANNDVVGMPSAPLASHEMPQAGKNSVIDLDVLV